MADLDVVIRYDIDTRLFWLPGNNAIPYLGLVIDLSTANVIDLKLRRLIELGVDITGKYVCRHEEPDREYLRPRIDLIGMVSQVIGDRALLTDTEGISEVSIDEAYLEPRSEYLDDVILKVYGRQANRVISKLREIRGPLSTANAKLDKIKQTLNSLKEKHQIVLGGDFKGNIWKFSDPWQRSISYIYYDIETEFPFWSSGPKLWSLS